MSYWEPSNKDTCVNSCDIYMVKNIGSNELLLMQVKEDGNIGRKKHEIFATRLS